MPIPLPQWHKAMNSMESWWAWKDSNLRPRDYESHEQFPHVFSNLKKSKDRFDLPSTERPRPNLDTEQWFGKSKKRKGSVDRNRSRTEPFKPNAGGRQRHGWTLHNICGAACSVLKIRPCSYDL